MFFCDPFGYTRPENLYNFGRDDTVEHDYVFFHDQEPVDVNTYKDLFDTVLARNADISPYPRGAVVVSELGEAVESLSDIYGWTTHYYFFHGWAALDWFRGYDKSFLIPRYSERKPGKTFFSPNRIVGGTRDHRVLFLYHLFKKNLHHNHISAPRWCPHENTDILDCAEKYLDIFPDITQVLEQAGLPRHLPGETVQIMSSCFLDNFDCAADSMLYVPTETVYFGRRQHITEKTFKAIALEMPFVLVAPAHSLSYLRRYGFRTFAPIWDEGYDEESDDISRLAKVTDLLKHLDQLSATEKSRIKAHCNAIVEHNFQHFYGGGFEQLLWQEFTAMLHSIGKSND